MKNNDIYFEKNNIIFNYRVAIIIKNKDKILVQKDNRATHLTLPGGRCELGESSDETASREFFEETGINTNFVKSLGIIENFFISSFNQKHYHEILIINELAFENIDFYNKNTINNIEENKKEHIKYLWKSIDDLKNEDFRPKLMLDVLNNNSFVHLINKD